MNDMKKRSWKIMGAVSVVLAVLMLLCSCSEHYQETGIDYWRNHGNGMSSYSVTRFKLDESFLDKYPYMDGDFNYEFEKPGPFSYVLEYALMWLSYDEDTYEMIKQDNMDAESVVLHDGQETFGFTFYLRCDWDFPRWFTAVGYNDEKKTLVFLGFYCSSEYDKEKAMLAETDMEEFLEYYYGEWYSW